MNLTDKYVLNSIKFLVINVIVNLLLSYQAFPQQKVDSILSFANNLYSKGYYDDAITEFFRVNFWNKNKSILSQSYLGMGLCYREMNQWDKSIHAFQKAINFANNDSLLQEIKLTKATTYIAAGKFNQAQIDLIMLVYTSNNINVKNQAALLLTISAILQKDWLKTKNYLDQFHVFINNPKFAKEMTKILEDIINNKKKSPVKAKWLSTLLPGLGQLYANDYRNALNAFFFNVINFSTTVFFLSLNDYSSAVMYFTFLTERYYSGNRYQAQQSVYKYQAKINNSYSKKLLFIIKNIDTFSGK